MLQKIIPWPDAGYEDDAPTSAISSLQAFGLFGCIARHFLQILFVVAGINASSFGYLVVAADRYTATTTLVIDPRKGGIIQPQSAIPTETTPGDQALVNTQIEMLKSEKVALTVVKDLKLAEDREFFESQPNELLERAVNYVSGHDEFVHAVFSGMFGPRIDISDSDFTRTRVALSRIQNSVTIKRRGLSYIIDVSVTSSDADKAARIANTLVEAYIAFQNEAKDLATKAASTWLQDRVSELGRKAAAAELAVIEFKEKSNIINTSGTYRAVVDQQLAELNTQLTIARTATAAARARFDRILDIMRQEVPDETVADALKNEVITRLRGQYMDLKIREANISQKYGSDHISSKNLRETMDELRRLMAEELRRISEGYKSDYDIARGQEQNIESTLDKVVAQAKSSNRAQIKLRELESNAQSYRTSYETFLARYTDAVQQQSFPVTEVRIVSAASRPVQKSQPRPDLIIPISLGGSLVLGFGIAMFRAA